MKKNNYLTLMRNANIKLSFLLLLSMMMGLGKAWAATTITIDGVTYTLSNAGTADGTATVSATGSDTNTTYIIKNSVTYNGYTYLVNNLGEHGHDNDRMYNGKKVVLEDALVANITQHRTLVLPEQDPHVIDNIPESVSTMLQGESNATVIQKMWKQATVLDNSRVRIDLSFFQSRKTNDAKIGFIFLLDETDTMAGDLPSNISPGYAMQRRLFSRSLLKMFADAITGTDNRMDMIVYGRFGNDEDRFRSTGVCTPEAFKTSIFDNYISGDAGGGTLRDYIAGKMTTEINAMKAAGYSPVIIILSDYAWGDACDGYYALNYNKYAVGIIDGHENNRLDWTKIGNTTYSNRSYRGSDLDSFISAMESIFLDAVSSISTDTKFEDELSSPLQGTVTSPTGTQTDNNGKLTITSEGMTWEFVNASGNPLPAGQLYTKQIICDLSTKDDVISGSANTNGACFVTKGAAEVNRITASPVLRAPLTLVLKSANTSGAPLAGATFKLERGTNTWNLTTDANGQLVLPWGENDVVGATTAESTFAFKPNDTYNLTQLSTAGDYWLPSGYWALTVGNDYRITSTANSAKGNSILDMEAHAGKLEIYNETVKIARVSNDGGTTWTYHEYLINSSGTGTAQGAFNYANTLSGDVIIETLLETAVIGGEDRYSLNQGFTFNKNGMTSLTLRTTQDDDWNPAVGDPAIRFTSTITKNQNNASMITVTSAIPSLVVENLIFDGGGVNGSCSTNGGIFNVASNEATFTDCDFQHSIVVGNCNGGAVSYTNPDHCTGSVALYGCVFNDCQAPTGTTTDHGNGGGFYVRQANSAIVDKSATRRSSFTGCIANRFGGAIVFEDDRGLTLSVKHTDFVGCQATTQGGGAVYSDAISNTEVATTIDDCTFTDCSASNTNNFSCGGAIGTNMDTGSSSVTISVSNCTFTHCSANNGGAIYPHSTGSTLNIANCTFKDCEANNNGGAVYSKKALTVTDCSMTGGKAQKGGGIYLASGARLKVSGVVVVDDNKNGAALNNVYLDDVNNKYVTIDAAGLDCGSHIGITKTTGYTTDGNSIQHTNIAQGSATNCWDAFRRGVFFDDLSRCGAYNFGANTTIGSVTYNNEKVYFIESWEAKAKTAVAGTDYTLADDHVATVSTAKGLAYLAKDVNSGKNYSGKIVTLAAGIDLDGSYWLPIGQRNLSDCTSADAPFSGTFDGNGKVISNLKSILPYQDLGLFGLVQGGTVKNTFINGGTLAYTNSSAGNLGGIVGKATSTSLINGCEAAGIALSNPNNATNLSTGGIAGALEGTGEVRNSFVTGCTFPSSGTTGALVGTTASGTNVKNCFARGNSVALVGSNGGTLSNAYTDATTGSIVGSGNGGTNVYAAGTVTGATAYTPTATFVSDKYGYGLDDQKVGENDHLVDLLNHWVDGQSGSDYAQWTRTMASPINGDYPVLMLEDFECLGSLPGESFITYNADINAQIAAYNAVDKGNIYLYDATSSTTVTVSTNTNSDVRVFIDENIGILQSDGNTLNARVGVTFDNSKKDASLWGEAYDWHTFSSALTAAPTGLVYGTDYNDNSKTYPFRETGISNANYNNSTIMTPPQTTWSSSEIGYFPTNTPYADFDFYVYGEAYHQHWINLKRKGASDFYDHWRVDANASGKHENIKYTNETYFEKGKGYLMAIKDESMLMADGQLNNGDVTYTATITTQTDDNEYNTTVKGTNLIGNPYQSYLDFQAFTSATQNSGKISDNAYYVIDADCSGYIAYPENSSVNPEYASRYIHPHQGFFVKVTAGENLTFNNDMRVAGKWEEGLPDTDPLQHSNFREEHLDYPLVNLICFDGNGKRDLTTVEINRPDVGGAHKMKALRIGDALLSARFDNRDYQALFAPEGVNEVPVRFEAFEDGIYTMNWSMFNGDFHYVHLIDNITGADIDLLAANEYKFEGKTSDYVSRFRLVFEVTDIDEHDDDASTGATTFAFQNGDELVVTGNGILQFFDLNGRCLMSTQLIGEQSSVSLPNVASGMYLLRLTGNKQTQVQKIIIK